MKRRRSVKARSSSGTKGFDMISALPQHLIEEILSRLSLRDAVRTSVLSSKWREKWTTLPRLVFDEDCISPVSGSLSPEAMAKAVDTIFALHQGPVKSLAIHLFSTRPNNSDICRWIHHLSGLSIEELTIDFQLCLINEVHSCIFACQDLISLELNCCPFRLPSNFTGLKNLTKLILIPDRVAQDTLENLVSSCPQLMKLEMSLHLSEPKFTFDHFKITALNLQHLKVDALFKTLKIDAPNLQRLHLDCLLEDIHVNTYSLLSLSLGYGRRFLDFNIRDTRYEKTDVICKSLLKLFVQQSRLKYVDLDIYFIQYLSVSGFPYALCNSLVHLKHLNVSINFSCMEEVSATLCLLRNCPTLESIQFSTWNRNGGNAYAVSKFLQGENSSCLFKHLKNVWVEYISDKEAEASFIKFVMSSSPILENMVIRPSKKSVSTERRFELLRQLLQCPRQNRALVFYMDPDDTSREPRYNLDNIL